MIASVGRMMRKGGGGLIWPKGLKESIKAIISFGRTNSIIFADSGIVYQTKNSYNGIGIESGLLDDTDVLIIVAAQQNINNSPQDIYILAATAKSSSPTAALPKMKLLG